MKERPILFSGPMVQAILKSQKTQTRREVKWPLMSASDGNKRRRLIESDAPLLQEILKGPFRSPLTRFSPYGQPGDRLWVRETTCIAPKRFATPDETCIKDYEGDLRFVSYKADGHSEDAMRDYKLKWTPSIHVPRWASRITLEVVSIRVERLQEITEADAIAEGVGHNDVDAAVVDYASLWDRINGPGSWKANPFVWVVEFKRVEVAA